MNPTHADIIKQQVERFVEEGAALEHARWARWQEYLHSRLTYTETTNAAGNKIAAYIMTADDYERWQRQIDTDYKDLTEREKESDRKEVREYIPLLTTAMHAAAHATEKAGDVEEKEYPKGIQPAGLTMQDIQISAHNAAIAQSRRQLDAHFGRTKNGVEF